MKGDSWVILIGFFLSSTPRGIFEWQAREAGERFGAMYLPLLGCAGDRDEMVVKVHPGAVFGHHVENAPLKTVPQCTLNEIISTRSPAQPQSGELQCIIII